MNSKERLKEYVDKDIIYNSYINGTLKDISDFDDFCIQHCMDIEDLLKEVDELNNKLKRIVLIVDEQILDGNMITYEDFAKKIKKEINNESIQIKL